MNDEQSSPAPVSEPRPTVIIQQAPTNGSAVASLVLGIIALVGSLLPLLGVFLGFILGVLALVLGLGALGSVAEKGGQPSAIAGTICGGLGFAIAVLQMIGLGALFAA